MSKIYTLTTARIGSLQGLLRQTTVMAGALARQEVQERIVALVKLRSKERQLEIDKDPEKFTEELKLTSEHLGGIKLAFIQLWKDPRSTGAVREVIADLSGRAGFNFWNSHIVPNLPKDENLAIDGDDDTPDILQGDSSATDPG